MLPVAASWLGSNGGGYLFPFFFFFRLPLPFFDGGDDVAPAFASPSPTAAGFAPAGRDRAAV